MNRKSWVAVVLIALLAGSTMTGCGTLGKIFGGIGGIFSPNRHNDFAEANLRIKAKEQKYTEARLAVVNADGNPREGVLTIAQYRKFQALEQNVIDATKTLYVPGPPSTGDIAEWRRTNTKPADYEAHERTLFAAIDELIAFVNKEAAKTASVSFIARERLASIGLTPEVIKLSATASEGEAP